MMRKGNISKKLISHLFFDLITFPFNSFKFYLINIFRKTVTVYLKRGYQKILGGFARKLNRKDFDELVKAKMFDQDELEDLVLTGADKIEGDKEKRERIYLSALEQCEKLGYGKDSIAFTKIKLGILSFALAEKDQEKVEKAKKHWKESIEYLKNHQDKYNYNRLELKYYYFVIWKDAENSDPMEYERLMLELINYYNESDCRNPDISLIKILGEFYFQRREIEKMSEFLKQCLENFEGNGSIQGKINYLPLRNFVSW